jgi:predicted AAA+ superfamily ATPase
MLPWHRSYLDVLVTALSATVKPRRDVLEGALIDVVFAANLDDVVRGQAPEAYGDPALFFTQTFPSLGLTTDA